MSIKSLGSGKWLVRTRISIDGKSLQRKRIITGSREDARKLDVEFREALKLERPGSLKITTFADALRYFREHTTAKLDKIECLLTRLEKDLGGVQVKDLTQKFGDYLLLLKKETAYWTGNPLTDCTRNKLLCYAKLSLNLCLKRGLIERNPLAGFSKVPEEARDRILTEDEESRLLEALACKRNPSDEKSLSATDAPKGKMSFLYWPVRFSLRNPIRKGDLIALTKENLDRFRPWVHFMASKTRKRKQRETCLPFLDSDLLAYFDSLPTSCPYLFTRGQDADGDWQPLGDFKAEWQAILKQARIEDFHWHDLKHCAITWILDSGYSERDLKNLGIQYSAGMIDRYYHADASKVLRKWQGAQKSRDVNQEIPQKKAVDG